MNLKCIEACDIRAFEAMFPEERLFVKENISGDYSHDEMEGVCCPPDILIMPVTTAEISAVAAYCNEQSLPLVVRGSGTGLAGGAVAIHGGVMLDMTLMNKILHLDKRNMTLTVQSGALLMEVAAFAENNGLFYPPDPGEKTATIGGNISTNAGGMRAVKYGVTRDYVLSLKVVLADGTVETFGTATEKNSSGYSILDLIIGSEGTLAIVVEATLKLLPKPAYTTSILAAYEDFPRAIAAVPKILLSGAEPTAVEFLTRNVIELTEKYMGRKFPGFDGNAALLLTIDDNSEQMLKQRVDNIAELCLEEGALDCYYVDTQERMKSVWQIRGAFFEAVKASAGALDEGDVVVPKDSIPELVDIIDNIALESGLRTEYFGHAGDGNLHIYYCRNGMDEALWQAKLKACFDKLYAAAAEIGGTVSGEHGIGFAKQTYLKKRVGENQMALMRRIKHAFDPNGILNPGKVCFE